VIAVPVLPVPVTLSIGIVKSTIAAAPLKPEETRSIVTRLPQYLSLSMPPKSSEPPADLSLLVYKLNALEAIYPAFTRDVGKLGYCGPMP
jgi:hypothetical protein